MVYIQPLGFVRGYKANQAVPSMPATSYDYSLPLSVTLPSRPSDSDSDGATALDVVLSSDASAVSLIQITALPPVTTSFQAIPPKLPYHHELNILYLVPLFVAAGVALGSIASVILLKLRENRRRLLRTSTLLPGPPYVPPENDVEDRLLVHGLPSMESVSLFAASTPSKVTVHGSRYVPKRMLGWQPRSITQPTSAHTIIPSGDGEKFAVITQEDPFLATSPIVQASSSLSKDISPPKIHVSPSLLEPTSRDNFRGRHSQGTGLPKPFRRSMFDIMKLKGPYRPVSSIRKDYAVLTPKAGPVDSSPTNRVRRVSTSKGAKVTSLGRDSQSREARHFRDDGLHSSNMEDALGLLGSQGKSQNVPRASQKQTPLLEQGTSTSPGEDRNTMKPLKATPFAPEQTGSPTVATFHQDELINSRGGEIVEENLPDIYTKAPQRHCSGTPRKTLSASGTSTRFSAPDAHASILPLSPPALMSPPLEKSLFFTSSLSSRTSLAGRTDIPPASSFQLRHIERSPEFYLFPSPSKRSKATKKLQTSRPEPPLPYPSYPDHVRVQPTSRQVSNTAETNRRPVSPPELNGRSTSTTYQESATAINSLGSLSPTTLAIALASSSSSDVLNKVNDIVAEGYTRRRTSIGGSGSVAASSSNPN